MNGRRPAQVLQGFGGGLVLRVEAALPVIDASLAGVLAGALQYVLARGMADHLEWQAWIPGWAALALVPGLEGNQGSACTGCNRSRHGHGKRNTP